MYLPQPSLGLDLYTEALEAVHNLIEQVPRDLRPFNIMVGCDANCSVRNHEELDMLVGPLTHPTRWTDGDSSRTQVFVDFILRLGLRVSNTFPAADVELPGSTACWTHSWHVDPSVAKQIDFVLCTCDCISESRVMYDLNCCSDHKLLACKAILKLADPVTKTAGRVRTVGFRIFIVFFGPRPWHIDIRHRVDKTYTINLCGFEILKLKFRRLKLWKPAVRIVAVSKAGDRDRKPTLPNLPVLCPSFRLMPLSLRPRSTSATLYLRFLALLFGNASFSLSFLDLRS